MSWPGRNTECDDYSQQGRWRLKAKILGDMMRIGMRDRYTNFSKLMLYLVSHTNASFSFHSPNILYLQRKLCVCVCVCSTGVTLEVSFFFITGIQTAERVLSLQCSMLLDWTNFLRPFFSVFLSLSLSLDIKEPPLLLKSFFLLYTYLPDLTHIRQTHVQTLPTRKVESCIVDIKILT